MRKYLLLLIVAGALGAGMGRARFSMPQFSGPTLHIAFINVSQGDSILIQTPDGRSALIDAGGPEDGNTVLSFLRRHGVNRLDMVALTRPRPDHIGGMAEIMESMPVEHLIDCGCSYSGRVEQETLKALHEQNTPYCLARAGQTFHLGNATIEILSPQKPLISDAPNANNNCVVARVAFGGVSALLLSDAGPGEEAQLVADCPDLACDVLKVSHYAGSRTTSNELLKLAKPQYAVIPGGIGSKRSRVVRDITSRLQAAGAKIMCTDDYGAVIVATDGRRLSVTGER